MKCTFLFIFSTFLHILTCKMEPSMVNHQNKVLIQKFVSQYKNHLFILYWDKNEDFDIISIVEMFPAYIFVLHDTNYIPDFLEEREKTVNIFFMKNSTHLPSKVDNKKFFSQHSCNVFITYKVSSEICHLSRVELAPGAFIIDMVKSELLSCFNEAEELKMTVVQPGEIHSIINFHRNYSNLHGKALRVIFIDNPTISYRIDEESGHYNFEGPDANIVDTLGRTLNFVPDLQEYKMENQSIIWDELVTAVHRGKADFAAGSIMITLERLPYFTSHTWTTPEFVVLFVNPTQEIGLKVILSSFDWLVYMIFFILMIFCVMVVAFTSFIDSQYFRMLQFSQVFLKLVLEQSCKLSNQLFANSKIRFTLIFWILLNIVISSTFRSSLASLLVKPKVYDFRSINELIENNFVFWVQDWCYYFFMDSSIIDKNRLQIRRFGKEKEEQTCKNAKYLFQYRLAVVYSEFGFVRLRKTCGGILPIEKIPDMNLLMEKTMYLAYPMRKHLPYRRIFSMKIGQMKNAGLIQYWYNNVKMKRSKRNINTQTSARPLKMKQLYSFFRLYLSGSIVGVIVMLLELLKARFIE